jgi:hypothetical protein
VFNSAARRILTAARYHAASIAPRRLVVVGGLLHEGYAAARSAGIAVQPQVSARRGFALGAAIDDGRRSRAAPAPALLV